MQKILAKSKLPSFIEDLIKSHEVIAPVKNPNTKFQKISSFSDFHPATPTQVPAKQHFMPEGEPLLEFKNNKPKESKGKIPKTILFGLRLCDLNAIQILDNVMWDTQYLEKRKNTTLIGMFCDSPDQYCFCNSMMLEDFYDLFFYPKGKNYIIDVKSKKGEALVKNLETLKEEIKIPRPKNKKKLKNLDIEKNYKDSIWKRDSKKCLSCSACTIYCPTCNCFDMKDTSSSDMAPEKRIRRQASCMLKSFSKVAGGKSYRDSRVSRFKHFVYHKISYYKSTHGRPMCVGCGRCLRVCPTKIDWVRTINKLPKKK